MTGVSLFLLGTVALSNIGFLAYLLIDRNNKLKPPVGKPPEEKPEAAAQSESEENHEPRSFVGKSKFNIDDEFESRIDRMVDRAFDRNIHRVREAMMGDVRIEDVEFGEDDGNHVSDMAENNVAGNTDAGKPQKEARMSPEQSMASFEDVRIEDVEPDTVSPPSATGVTMDEIDESISTAINPEATDEEKVKAGKILGPLMDTNLMDNLLSYEEIYKGIQGCMTALLRSDIADKSATRTARATPSKKKAMPPVSAQGQSRTFQIAENIDDFDPADLLT